MEKIGGAAPLLIGMRLFFEDHGPGITDIEEALRDGFSTTKGLGLGLGGNRRLVDEFEIASTVGVGRTVVIIKWQVEFKQTEAEIPCVECNFI